MLRRILFIAIVAATTAQVLAIPGQTEAQLATWGKANPALHGFKATMDEETGGTNYMASVRVDGHDAEFNAEPERGVVHTEYISFADVNDVTKNTTLLADTLTVIYGEAYARDFRNAARNPHKGRAVAWLGKKLAYVAFAASFFMVRNDDVPNVLKNLRACDALDCSD